MRCIGLSAYSKRAPTFFTKYVPSRSFGSHVTWNSAMPDPNMWCCILLFLCTLGDTHSVDDFNRDLCVVCEVGMTSTNVYLCVCMYGSTIHGKINSDTSHTTHNSLLKSSTLLVSPCSSPFFNCTKGFFPKNSMANLSKRLLSLGVYLKIIELCSDSNVF